MPRGTRAPAGNKKLVSSRANAPQIIAHRGACTVCPENTLVAFHEGMRRGADGIELDLQLSKDGEVVVYHDGTLGKVGGRGAVRTKTLAELRRLDAGGYFSAQFSGTTIPTLAEVLDRFAASAVLMLEIKAQGEPRARREALVAKVLAMVARHPRARVRILAFDGAVLRQVAETAPGVPRVRNHDRVPTPAGLRRVLADAHVLCVPARLVNRALGLAVRALDRELWVYRCDTAGNLAKAMRAGVAGIISDRPDWVRSQLLDYSGPKRR